MKRSGVVSAIAAAAAAAAVVLQTAIAAAAVNDDSGSGFGQRRRHAPPRPRDAPDIDYGVGVHPFDQYRHLYDDRFINNDKMISPGTQQQYDLQNGENIRRRRGNNNDNKSRMMKWLNNNGEYNNEKNDNSNNSKNQQQRQMQEETTTTTTPTYITTTLNPSTDSLYKPLRIQFDVRHLIKEMENERNRGSNTDIIKLTKLYLLIYEILPMTASVWGDILRVIPVSGGIYPLDSTKGSSAGAWLPKDSDGGDEGSESTKSGGGAAEADSVLYDDPVRAFYCPDDTTSGISGGADLLIYATVNRHCGSGPPPGTSNNNNNRRRRLEETLASALSCQRDQYDRPVTGSIDFCLSGMNGISNIDVDAAIAAKEANGLGPTPNDFGENVIVGSYGASMEWEGWYGKVVDEDSPLEDNIYVVQYAAGVAIHEMGHVLGMSSDSLSYFRHPITGYPLTPRPFTLSTVTCVTGEEKPFIGKPSATVMGERIDKGTGQRYYEVTTSTVKRIVQNHFNCSTATGARLENQPTGGDCFGSHFDERLFFTDIMGAVFSPAVNVLSPLVLAYLEDSGWYRANYQSRYVHIGSFGHGAGCAFLDENCIDSNGNVPEAMEGNFCNTLSVNGGGYSSGPQQCDPSHMSKAYCDYVDTNSLLGIGKTGQYMDPAPESYQYVDDNPNLRPYSFTLADYCPIAHLSPYSCSVDGGKASQEQLNVGEYYGSDSRCVETDGSRSYSLCLQTKCNKSLGQVQIIAGGQIRTCEYDGQLHEVYSPSNAVPVRIKCPKASLICPELFCPANCAGRGECVYRTVDQLDTSGQQPMAQCVCDSEDDTTEGCFRTPLQFSETYGPAMAYPNRADKAVFLAIVGSLVAGLAILYMVVRQWKARQNVFM